MIDKLTVAASPLKTRPCLSPRSGRATSLITKSLVFFTLFFCGTVYGQGAPKAPKKPAATAAEGTAPPAAGAAATPPQAAPKTAPKEADADPKTDSGKTESPEATEAPRHLPPPTVADAAAADLEKQDNDCFPSCRSGHLCHRGQCISACNPECPEGFQCTPQRQCLPQRAAFRPVPVRPTRSSNANQATPYYPWPPVPPSDMDGPVPPDHWEPSFDEPYGYDDHPFFVGTIGLQLGLGGVGSVYSEASGDTRKSEDYALDAGGGVEAAFEFRFHRHFGLAPGVRIFQVRSDNAVETATSLDLLVIPTFHLPLGQVELILPVPLGLSFGSAPDDLVGGDGGGVTVGFTPGLIAWLTEQVGVYTEFGFNWHIRGYQSSGIDYVYRFRRPVLTVGLTFTD